ncbi:hypothetical protein FW755_07900 [Lonepinella koalarum]|uniref:Porin n=1 Tax=Lonepinella koalarum TaxID=53417 RepID=A0A4R1KQ62_9PAST|nr:hypothetical protein [Lonepinella koalarum]MDH2925620.1 hypothetical protein [Lonepinella koalarum]TCK67186.1 hypothetical protein EV692_2095 [Lonepinella koalarum]TFJ89156.1 hypothetical protein E0709_09825 [Lonepinella koalarum]TYG35018.1 hypothetical protein FW755_07900 [Lonepinella koalarum]
MKKTFTIFFSIVLVSPSVLAWNVIDNKETGTRFDIYGGLSLSYITTSTKTSNAATDIRTKTHYHTPVQNDSTRIYMNLQQSVGGDYYLRLHNQLRFGSTTGYAHHHRHNFGKLYSHTFFGGFGHKIYGEFTYGNQNVFTDYIKQTDKANTHSIADGLQRSVERKVFQYVNKGAIKGLEFGAYYGGAESLSVFQTKLANKRKNVWGLGVIHKQQIDDRQKYVLAVGFSQMRNHVTNTDRTGRTTIYSMGSSYSYDKTTIAFDLDQRLTKSIKSLTEDRTETEARFLIWQDLTPQWAIYSQYMDTHNKVKHLLNDAPTYKGKVKKFKIGTEYYIIPKYVRVALEWQTIRTKTYEPSTANSSSEYKRTRENATILGLRIIY